MAKAIQERPHHLSLIFSVAALIVSGLSFWESHQARKLSYDLSLPKISVQPALIEPLTAGKQINLKIKVENLGKTTARGLTIDLKLAKLRSDMPFEPKYWDDKDFQSNASDLASGRHVFLNSFKTMALTHTEIDLVSSGEWKTYIYGRARYKDIDGTSHEAHMCRFYDPSVAADVSRLSYCDGYNDEN